MRERQGDRVRTPSSLVREREREGKGKGERERERRRERGTEKEKIVIEYISLLLRHDGCLGTF